MKLYRKINPPPFLNDEGWYVGQCRFSKLAPEWGRLYELKSDLKLSECANDWVAIYHVNGTRYYSFYLRDNTFECDAEMFEVVRLGTT